MPWVSQPCNLGLPFFSPWIIWAWPWFLHTLLTLLSTFVIRPFLTSAAFGSSPLNQVKVWKLALEVLLKLSPHDLTIPFSTVFQYGPATLCCLPPSPVNTYLFSRLMLSSSHPAWLSASATLFSLKCTTIFHEDLPNHDNLCIQTSPGKCMIKLRTRQISLPMAIASCTESKIVKWL